MADVIPVGLEDAGYRGGAYALIVEDPLQGVAVIVWQPVEELPHGALRASDQWGRGF